NVDLTYRLYDFGRPRELHLEQAVGTCRPEPYVAAFQSYEREPGRRILAEGGKFVLERWAGERSLSFTARREAPFWLIPLSGDTRVDGNSLEPGDVWLVVGEAAL